MLSDKPVPYWGECAALLHIHSTRDQANICC